MLRNCTYIMLLVQIKAMIYSSSEFTFFRGLASSLERCTATVMYVCYIATGYCKFHYDLAFRNVGLFFESLHVLINCKVWLL